MKDPSTPTTSKSPPPTVVGRALTADAPTRIRIPAIGLNRKMHGDGVDPEGKPPSGGATHFALAD